MPCQTARSGRGPGGPHAPRQRGGMTTHPCSRRHCWRVSPPLSEGCPNPSRRGDVPLRLSIGRATLRSMSWNQIRPWLREMDALRCAGLTSSEYWLGVVAEAGGKGSQNIHSSACSEPGSLAGGGEPSTGLADSHVSGGRHSRPKRGDTRCRVAAARTRPRESSISQPTTSCDATASRSGLTPPHPVRAAARGRGTSDHCREEDLGASRMSSAMGPCGSPGESWKASWLRPNGTRRGRPVGSSHADAGMTGERTCSAAYRP